MKNLVNIDLGFSHCKAVINGERYIIKSVIGNSKTLRFEDTKMRKMNHDYIITKIRGQEYFVADLAVQQSTIQLHSLKANRFDQTATKVLINTLFAMGLGSGDHEANVVSGLPVSHYAQYKQDIRSLFMGDKSKKHEYNVEINGEQIKGSVLIDEGKFIPQPFGCLIDMLLDEDGDYERKELARKVVAVIDIGFGTSDVYVTDQLEPADDLSFSTTTAMNTVYTLIAREIVEYGGKDFSGQLHKLEDTVRRGSINIYGKTFDLKPVIAYALEHTAQQLIAELYNNWKDQIWRIEQIYISGGGGIALADHLTSEFNTSELIPDSQWSVVRGYNKWGKRAWKDLGGESVGRTQIHVPSDTEN